jgi:hypothetical protein
VFEAEFHKLYGDKEAETEAAAALAAAEKQINAHNELFKEGKSSYFEKLNVDSDMPKDLFEKEKEGELLPQMRFGLGAILPPEEEWYTHPHLEEFYRDRQTPPASYDATALGMVTPARNQVTPLFNLFKLYVFKNIFWSIPVFLKYRRR